MMRYGWIALLFSVSLSGCSQDPATSDPWAFGSNVDAGSDTGATREFCSDCRWLRLLGGEGQERAHAIAVGPQGHIAVAGATKGSNFGEQTNAGDSDAFVALYGAAGTRQWLRLLGGPNIDGAADVAIDARGNVYVAGSTQAGVGASTDDSASDAFLAKFDAAGSRRWERVIGGDRRSEQAGGVAVDDDGGIYVVGSGHTASFERPDTDTKVVVIAKYASSGNQRWVRLLENPNDGTTRGTSVTTTGPGSVFVTGYMRASQQDPDNPNWSDVVVARFDTDGNRKWLEALRRPSPDGSRAIAADGDDRIYVAGRTLRSVGPSDDPDDAFVARYDATGNEQWVRSLQSSADVTAYGASTGPSGRLHVVGATAGNLGDQTIAEPKGRFYSPNDAFYVKYAPSGRRLHLRLFQTPVHDSATDITVDGEGRPYMVGNTAADVDGWSNRGAYDTFVAAMHK